MTAVIIDDEKKGRESLHKLISSHCPGVEIVAMAASAEDGYRIICEHHPDVVFLDIEMPNENGFSMLARFTTISFQVIFITAYDEYAIRAVRQHALDYLLKPIDIDELCTAVENAKKAVAGKPEHFDTALHPGRRLDMNSRIALPVKDGIIYLEVSGIIRIESEGSYSTFFSVDGKKYVVSKNLKEYEDLLPAKEFFRSHKSHLINMRKVKKYIRTDGNFAEMENGSVIEISRRKKDEFLQLMKEIT